MVCARSFFECGLAHNLRLSHTKRPAESSLAREGGSGSAGRFVCANAAVSVCRAGIRPADMQPRSCGQRSVGQGAGNGLRESPADEYRVRLISVFPGSRKVDGR